LIFSWKRERIFGTCLIETSVVDAHSKLPVSLGDDNRVDQSPWMVDLPDESDVKQLLYFFTDEVLLLDGLISRLCCTGLASG
jgi:hypothetical protein